MWTLIVIVFFWLPQSSDSGSITSINGFSSEQTCKIAGEQLKNKPPHNRIFGPKKDQKWASDWTTKDVYFSYECVEVK